MHAQEKLIEIKNKIDNGAADEQVTVRNFLQWFDAKRRGVWVVNSIRELLSDMELETNPDFQSAYIDSYITISKKLKSHKKTEKEAMDRELVGGYDSDPTYRAGLVPQTLSLYLSHRNKACKKLLL